jgi:hypothetical protein
MSQLRGYHYQALYVTMPWWALVRAAEVTE